MLSCTYSHICSVTVWLPFTKTTTNNVTAGACLFDTLTEKSKFQWNSIQFPYSNAFAQVMLTINIITNNDKEEEGRKIIWKNVNMPIAITHARTYDVLTGN